MEKTFLCPYCGRENSIFLEEGQGFVDELVSDCEICCKPIVIRIKVVAGRDEIEARQENE